MEGKKGKRRVGAGSGVPRTERTPTLLDLQQPVTLSSIVFPSTPALPQTLTVEHPKAPPSLTPWLKLSLQAIAIGVESIPEHNAHALNGCFSMPPVRCHQQMGS